MTSFTSLAVANDEEEETKRMAMAMMEVFMVVGVSRSSMYYVSFFNLMFKILSFDCSHLVAIFSISSPSIVAIDGRVA